MIPIAHNAAFDVVTCPHEYNPDQEDINRNGIGGVCECFSDFDSDNDVDGIDLAVFAADFGRNDCP